MRAGRSSELSLEERRACVVQLVNQGWTHDEIARLLSVSERTISRDRQAIRREHAIKPGARLGDEMLGEMHTVVLNSVQRLTRLANDADAPHYVRVWAETTLVKSYLQLFDKTRDLDYIASGSARLEHAVDNDVDTLRRRLAKAIEIKAQIGDPLGDVPRLEKKLAEAMGENA